jgi:hypothetical protein
VWLIESSEPLGYNSFVWDMTETYEEALDSAIGHWYDTMAWLPGCWLSEPEPADKVGSVILYEFNTAGGIIGEYTISNWKSE